MYKLKVKKLLDHKNYKPILELNFMETECTHQGVLVSKKFQLSCLKLSQQNLNIKNKN
jgi:hypothetical protein